MHHEPTPGDVLASKYRVERILGKGAMGMVVAVTHLDLGEPRAIKFMLPSARESRSFIERFLREARAAAKLRSEHVAKVYDVGRFDTGEPYMVMEMLAGTDLNELLERHGPQPPMLAVGYVVQALEAIGEAHSLGIVHRDLKPANLFVARDRDGHACVKVLDFGISKFGAGSGEARLDMTSASAILGSPYYMSPEQMRSSRDVDHRSDIWSIGCLLYQVLTGELPFGGTTMTAVVGAVLTETPRLLAPGAGAMPEGLAQVILRCLEKDRERRPGCAELALALAPFAPPALGPLLARISRMRPAPVQATTGPITGAHPAVTLSAGTPTALGAGATGAPLPAAPPPRPASSPTLAALTASPAETAVPTTERLPDAPLEAPAPVGAPKSLGLGRPAPERAPGAPLRFAAALTADAPAMRPLFVAFCEALGKALGHPVEGEVYPHYDDLLSLVALGRFEFAWLPPLITLRAARGGAVVPIALPVRQGVATYSTAMFVHARSRFARIEDSAGARAAWVDPLSVSGYLLARAMLRARGVSALGKELFLGSHDAVLAAVLRGESDIGAAFAHFVPGEGPHRAIASGPVRGEVRVLDEQHGIPMDILAARPGLPRALLDAVGGLLVGTPSAPPTRHACALLGAEGLARPNADHFAALSELLVHVDFDPPE